MPMPPFLRELRDRIGHAPVLLPSVAAVVRDDAGRVLCQLRSDTRTWGLPSGICEPGEQPARTVAREVYEETGLTVRPERILAVGGALRVDYPNGDVAEYVSILFACRWLGGEPRVHDDESLEVRFFAPGALPPIRVLEENGIDLRAPADGAGARFRWDDAWLPGAGGG